MKKVQKPKKWKKIQKSEEKNFLAKNDSKTLKIYKSGINNSGIFFEKPGIPGKNGEPGGNPGKKYS